MIRIKKYIISFFLLLAAVVCVKISPVFAEVSTSENTFSISPLNPETNEPQSTYYNLKMTPNQVKEIKVRLFNSSDKDIKVKVTLNNAATNGNGVISYAGTEDEDSSLKVPLTSLAKLKDPIVNIPKMGHYDESITIRMPQNSFHGEVLGGIRVTSLSESKIQTKEKPAVKANIAYSVAVLIREEDEKPEASMHLLDVIKENRDYRNCISAKLQNSAPRLVKKLEVNSKIYRENSNKLLYQASRSEMQMAPNSHFNFSTSLENTSIKAGKYTMRVSGKADGKPFSFTRNFSVTASEAKQLNKNAVYVKDEEGGGISLIYMLIGIIVLLSLILIYLYKKKINRK